jgi:hypothetical protein
MPVKMPVATFLLHQPWQYVGIRNLEPLNGCETIELNWILVKTQKNFFLF